MANEKKGLVDITTGVEVADANANGILDLTSGEVTQVAAIGATTISSTQWGYVGAMDQGMAKVNAVEFAGVNVSSGTFQLASGTTVNELSIDGTLVGNSDDALPTEKAVKTYVDGIVSGSIVLQGDWNATTNSPDITGTTTTGHAWRVSVAGSTDLGGITDWQIGDLAVKTAASWMKVDNTDIEAVWGNITGTLANQTDLQGALDAKEPTVSKGNLTETTSNVLTVVGGTGAVIGSGLTIEVDQADTDNDGYLSSTDWDTFNGKQAALTNGVDALTSDEVTQLATIGLSTISSAQWGYVGAMNENVEDVTAPALPSSTGTKGQIASDSNYVYKCTATDTWVRWAVVTSWS